jgi:hypothetical protein
MVCDQITFTSHPCKDPLRAMATLRCVGGPWSRAWLISFFALFLFFSYFMFSSSPRIRQQDNLCVPITVLSALTASPFHFPFLLYLLLHSLGQHLPTPRHYHAAAIRSLFHLFLAFPLCTYTYSIQLPSPAPPRLPLLYKLVLADEAAHMYIRQSSCLLKNKSIHPAVLCDQVVPSPSFLSISTHPRALSVLAIVQWNCCPHGPCRSLALVLSPSTHTHTLSLFSLSFLSLLFLDDTSTLAALAPILDTPHHKLASSQLITHISSHQQHHQHHRRAPK